MMARTVGPELRLRAGASRTKRQYARTPISAYTFAVSCSATLSLGSTSKRGSDQQDPMDESKISEPFRLVMMRR